MNYLYASLFCFIPNFVIAVLADRRRHRPENLGQGRQRIDTFCRIAQIILTSAGYTFFVLHFFNLESLD